MIVLLILVALAFDFMNGFHDAANSIATVVSTRVLTPRMAVAWAAFFNFVAAFGFGVAVATTGGEGVVPPQGGRPPPDFPAPGAGLPLGPVPPAPRGPPGALPPPPPGPR